MPSREDRDRLIQEILTKLYDAKAPAWSIQDKGVLVAAIKLQLEEKPQEAQQVINQ